MVTAAVRRLAFGALLAQFILLWATFFVLSSAVGWPATLGDPARIALPRLLAHGEAVRWGYGCYLLAALLLVPAAAGLNGRLSSPGWANDLSLGLATLAAFAKFVGIARWLFVMPLLARAFADPNRRAQVELSFDSWNAYAGGIGEVLGVGLLGGSWTLLVAFRVFASRQRGSRFVGGLTAVAGGLLFSCIPAHFGVQLGPILTLSNVLWQFSLLAVALWALTPPAKLGATPVISETAEA